MFANAFEQRALFTASGSQFNQNLEQLLEEHIAAQCFRFEVLVHLDYVAGLPQVHQPVNLVDQRHGPSTWCFIAQALARALTPGFELHLATSALFWRLIRSFSRDLFVVIFYLSLTAGAN